MFIEMTKSKNSVISSKTKDFLKEKYCKCDFCIIKSFESLEKSLLQDKELKQIIEFKDNDLTIIHLIHYDNYNKKINLKVKFKDEFESEAKNEIKKKIEEKHIDTIICGIASRLFDMQNLLFDYLNSLKAALIFDDDIKGEKKWEFMV